MKGWIAEVAEPSAEEAGWLALLLVLALVMFMFCGRAFFLDEALHDLYESRSEFRGIELLTIPIVAIAATRWRIGADRLTALRTGRLGPWLPLLMAAALIGLIAYLAWSWLTPLTRIGPDQFGVLRWFGTVLVAAFTIVSLPLFPRITATLAGAVAAPAMFALIHNTFLGSHEPPSSLPGDESASGYLAIGLLATPVWILGASWLSQGGRPLFHAAWSGAVMLCLAILGGIAQ